MDDIYLEKPFPAGINNTRCLNQDDAKSLLLDVKEVFDKNGMEFFLVFGTLLGAYRENNFIKHDTDIDIAVIGDGAEDAIDELIKNGRFSDKNIKSFKNRNFSLFRDNILLDIYPFVENEGGYRSKLGWKNNYRLSMDYFPLVDIEFLGENFKTVNNIEKYLESKYGKDWRIPKKFAHART